MGREDPVGPIRIGRQVSTLLHRNRLPSDGCDSEVGGQCVCQPGIEPLGRLELKPVPRIGHERAQLSCAGSRLPLPDSGIADAIRLAMFLSFKSIAWMAISSFVAQCLSKYCQHKCSVFRCRPIVPVIGSNPSANGGNASEEAAVPFASATSLASRSRACNQQKLTVRLSFDSIASWARFRSCAADTSQGNERTPRARLGWTTFEGRGPCSKDGRNGRPVSGSVAGRLPPGVGDARPVVADAGREADSGPARRSFMAAL